MTPTATRLLALGRRSFPSAAAGIATHPVGGQDTGGAVFILAPELYFIPVFGARAELTTPTTTRHHTPGRDEHRIGARNPPALHAGQGDLAAIDGFNQGAGLV